MSYRNGQEKYLDTSAKNYLLNGNFDFWQRGIGPTAGNGSGVYLADRWLMYANAGLSTVQKLAGYNDGSGSSNSALITFNSGDADVAFMQPLETLVSKPLQSKTITFSIYLKKGATFVDNVNISIRQSNDVDSRFLPTGQTVTLVTIPNSSISTSNFTRFSVTATILSGSSQVAVLVATDPTVNGSTLEIRQAMLNEGPTAAPFQTAGANIAEELAMCQRYYEIFSHVLHGRLFVATISDSSSGVDAFGFLQYAYKRVPPQITITGTWRALGANNGGAVSWTAADIGITRCAVVATTYTPGTGLSGMIQSDDTATGVIQLNAEL